MTCQNKSKRIKVFGQDPNCLKVWNKVNLKEEKLLNFALFDRESMMKPSRWIKHATSFFQHNQPT